MPKITNESIRDSEMEGVSFKILGRATLNVFIFIKVAGGVHLLAIIIVIIIITIETTFGIVF